MVRVLLVDDSPLFLKTLEGLLARLPDVTVVGQVLTAAAGLHAAPAARPDLVLLDLLLQDCNGIEALAHFKALTPSPRVVLMSLHHGRDYQTVARAAGADGFIAKAELAERLPKLFASFNAGVGWEDAP